MNFKQAPFASWKVRKQIWVPFCSPKLRGQDFGLCYGRLGNFSNLIDQFGLETERILMNTSAAPNRLKFNNGLLLATKTASLLLK